MNDISPWRRASAGVRPRSGIAGIRAALALLGLLAATSALAQTASQITPPDFLPRQAPPAGPVTIPGGTGAVPPPGAAKQLVRIAGIAVEGEAQAPAGLAALKARLTGRQVSVAEIFDAARELEASYARAGRVLVRVAVPPQSLADGATLRLVVVDGFIERIDTARVHPYVARQVAAVLAPLAGRGGLRIGDIERRLLLAASIPGVELRSALAPGSRPGASVLVVEAAYRPVTGFFALDNTLPAQLGRASAVLGLTANGMLGLGEAVYARIGGYPGASLIGARPVNRQLAAGLIVPIGHDGLAVNVEGVDARTGAHNAPGTPGFASHFERLSGRLRYPLVRRRDTIVSAELAFDAQREAVRIVDPQILPISRDDLRVARASIEASHVLAGDGTVSLRGQVSAGLDALGARSAADATPLLPLSRAGTDATFRKLELEARIDQPLARHLAVALRGRGQLSFGKPMANSEQFGIASADGISALPVGALQGDSGYLARAEIQAPFAGQGVRPPRIAPYVFAAYGRVALEEPTALERAATHASAYGLGARLLFAAAGVPALSLGAEYGAAHVTGAPRADRFNVSLIAQF